MFITCNFWDLDIGGGNGSPRPCGPGLDAGVRFQAASLRSLVTQRPPARGASSLLGEDNLEEPPALDHPFTVLSPPDHQLLHVELVVLLELGALRGSLGLLTFLVIAFPG